MDILLTLLKPVCEHMISIMWSTTVLAQGQKINTKREEKMNAEIVKLIVRVVANIAVVASGSSSAVIRIDDS